jgi:hypothetical protein
MSESQNEKQNTDAARKPMREEMTNVNFADPNLVVTLADGRILSVSLSLFPLLARASTQERNNYFLIEDGIGVHWPDLDVSLRQLLDLAT